MTKRPRPENALPSPRREWAYFLDIDGTLVDLSDSPARMGIDVRLLRLIEKVSERTNGALALISGRSVADIDRLFPGTRLPAAGQHGIERRSATGRVHSPRVARARLRSAHAHLAAAASTNPGLLVEDKGFSLALHYRRAPRLAGYAHRIARTALRQLGARYQLLAGKRVVELRPAGNDKGRAVQEFLREPPFRGRTPVYMGDDVTDEDAFVTVNRLLGYSIKIGPGRTRARWRLRDVSAATTWLRAIARKSARSD